MTEYILWATPKNQPAWAEVIITVTTDKTHLGNATKWAEEHDFENIRILEYAGEKPDFAKTIKI